MTAVGHLETHGYVAILRSSAGEQHILLTPELLQRREQEDMIIIPIVVRDCLWQSEPVLKDLQALPTDGKAVITFSEATGERDKVWMEIAQAIEKRARK